MTGAAVDVRGFGYRASDHTRWTPRNISFVLEPGERVLLLGASGSGKSTLLRALASLLDPSGEHEGQVAIDGLQASSSRERIGLMMQDPDSFLVLDRVGDDVAFGPQNQGLPPNIVAARTQQALDLVGFEYSPSREVDQLSGGERQRVALAGVLAMQPDLLLLDEPTSQLDPDGGALIREAVGKAVDDRNTTLLVVEHNVGQWLDLIDRVLILGADGSLTDGKLADVMASDAARDTWLNPRRVNRTVTGQFTHSRPSAQCRPLLQAGSLTHTYPRADEPAITDISCTINSGSITAISGPNGSGKSTLIRVLGGLVTPQAGTVTATEQMLGQTGRDLLTTNVWDWSSRALTGRIGSVFQNPEHSFVASTVGEEIEFGPRTPNGDERAEELLTDLELSHLVDVNPFMLSGGEQRRLSVAAALSTAPKVLILDEPTFGQDPSTWQMLVELVGHERDRGTAVVVVSHDVLFVDAVADTRLVMQSGHILSRESPDEEVA